MSKLIDWDGDTTINIIDLFIEVFEDNPWGFAVTHIYGSGGALMVEGDGYSTEKNAKLAVEYWFDIEGRRMLLERYLGSFDNPHESTPSREPDCRYCPFCTDTYRLGGDEPLMTVSLMLPGDVKSYFYRCHKRCYQKDAERVSDTEGCFIALIEQENDSELCDDE